MFSRKVKRVANRQYKRGQLSELEYQKVQEALKNPQLMEEWEKRVEQELRPPWQGNDDDRLLPSIWEWFVEHWDEILKILMMLLPLFLAEPEDLTEENK